MVLITLPQGISSFSLFSLLHIRVNGLMGFSLKLSISLSLSEDWKQMRVSFFETLFETLSDYLALSYHFINICPCFYFIRWCWCWWDAINYLLVYCDLWLWIFLINSCDWGPQGLSEWGGGWGHGAGWDIWIGEVNAHGVCSSTTNKQ